MNILYKNTMNILEDLVGTTSGHEVMVQTMARFFSVAVRDSATSTCNNSELVDVCKNNARSQDRILKFVIVYLTIKS